ncbi:MAG: outer membrane protein [Methylovirgula sp.]
MIRSLLVSSILSFAAAGAAFAADLPSTKGEPVYAPPPLLWNWTGFYIGANAGLSTGTDTFSATDEDFFGSGGYRATSGGFSGGGQIGYNYQFDGSNFVLGVEADFEGSTQKGTYVDEFEGDESAAFGTKVNWWGTARGRIGYAFGNILPYVTGGFAYGHVSDYISGVEIDNENFSWGTTRTGWTAGAGVEYAITHNLSAKIEYLYTDLGSWNYGGYPISEDGEAINTKVAFHTVRAGLNWKFDFLAPPAPVVAKY